MFRAEDCLYLDWSEDALRFKLEQLAATILAYNDGIGPDILALQEVENITVLERLRRDHLQPAGYLAPVLIEGADDRGIDVAFLARLPLVGEPVLHPVDMSAFPDGAQNTRGLLHADGTPKRFNLAAREGVFDHLPIVMSLEFRP